MSDFYDKFGWALLLGAWAAFFYLLGVLTP